MDGSVGSVPDSLKKAFKTSRGRKVFDGGGIDPDVVTTGTDIATISQTLFNNGYIFTYATEYYVKHPTIAPANEFHLTDQEYSEFVAWMKTKTYNYRSPVEINLAMLTEEAKKQRAYDELKPQLDQLRAKLDDSRKNDLHTFKDQLMGMLEEDIAAHYYLETGATEVGFKRDEDVKKSIDLLNNTAAYKKILNME
jgi:carboxyl-terminal processing protease